MENIGIYWNLLEYNEYIICIHYKYLNNFAFYDIYIIELN